MDNTKYVVYLSEEWQKLTVSYMQPRSYWGWVTWSVEAHGEVEIAKTILTRL